MISKEFLRSVNLIPCKRLSHISSHNGYDIAQNLKTRFLLYSYKFSIPKTVLRISVVILAYITFICNERILTKGHRVL
jgi:hypothetical protein